MLVFGTRRQCILVRYRAISAALASALRRFQASAGEPGEEAADPLDDAAEAAAEVGRDSWEIRLRSESCLFIDIARL